MHYSGPTFIERFLIPTKYDKCLHYAETENLIIRGRSVDFSIRRALPQTQKKTFDEITAPYNQSITVFQYVERSYNF